MPKPKGQHPNTAKRYKMIQADYAAMDKKRTPKGRPVYNHTGIVEGLAAKWGLSEYRISAILKMPKPTTPTPGEQLSSLDEGTN